LPAHRLLKWLRHPKVFTLDDRGRAVPLCGTPSPHEFPKLPWWATSSTVARIGDPWVTELKFQSRHQVWDQVAWWAVFILVELCFTLWWPGREWWMRLLTAILVSLPVGLVVHARLERTLRRKARRTIREAYLIASRCPSCRAFIDINPGADGCSECACGAAWRVPDDARRDAAPENLPLLPSSADTRLLRGECPWCGYSRIGLPEDTLCPECGSAKEGQLAGPPRPPVGRPVCARCRASMRGREVGRTCPDCGAMYGVEWAPEDEEVTPQRAP